MGYYDNHELLEAKGIDYDLCACLEYNPQPFVVEDIEQVLAVYEGENDSEDWRWILQLNDGRFVFLKGGCDYTGWDCQSWADSAFAESADLAAQIELKNKFKYAWMQQGEQKAYDSLMLQLAGQKQSTSHQEMMKRIDSGTDLP